MGYLKIFCQDCHQKELKKCQRKVRRSTQKQSTDRPETEFKVACDVIESVNLAQLH